MRRSPHFTAAPSLGYDRGRIFEERFRMSLTVIHLENSRSDRLIWLLEELALDYEI